MVLKDKGLLEKEFAKDGITIRWVQSARLQQGARIPQRRLDRFRLDRRRGRAGRQDQRQPDQVDLRLFAARMDRARDARTTARSAKIADLKGKRVAVTRGTDPHIFLVRALAECKLTEKDVKLGAAAACRRQDRADPRRRRRLGRSRPDDGAGRGRGRRQAVLPQARTPTPGASSTCARSSPRITRSSCKRVLAVYEERAQVLARQLRPR